jgi:hypothetical protein
MKFFGWTKFVRSLRFNQQEIKENECHAKDVEEFEMCMDLVARSFFFPFEVKEHILLLQNTS